VWLTVICMVVCALCFARQHLYVLEKDDRVYVEVRAQEIKDHTILKVRIRLLLAAAAYIARSSNISLI
jgi:hypothetical protein